MGVNRDVQQLPKRYVAQVDSKSHDEDELEQEIQDIQREIQMMDELTKMIGKIDQGAADKLKNSTKGVRSDEEARLRKLKRILRDFRRYDRESGGLFSDLDALREAFDTATREIKSCTIQSGSKVGFKIPKDMEWAHYVNKKWKQMEERQRKLLREENRKIKENVDDASSKLNDGISFLAAAGKDCGKGLSKALMGSGDSLIATSEGLDKGNTALGFLMAGEQTYSDAKRGKSFGVSLLKNCGGVVLGVGAMALLPEETPALVVAAVGYGTGKLYDAAYKHIAIFRHGVNDCGHCIDKGIQSIKNMPHDYKSGERKASKIINHTHVSGLPKGYEPGPNGYSTASY